MAGGGQGFHLGIIGAGDEATVGGVGVLVRLLGGKDYVVAHPNRLEAEFFDSLGEFYQGFAIG